MRRIHGTITGAFGIDVAKDDDEVHPKCFCDRCYAALQRKVKAAKESRVMLTSLKPVEWGIHTDENCETCKRCEGVMKGGRPRKERKNRGKPGINSCHAVIDHIWQIKSPLLYNDLDSFTVTTANQPVHLSEDENKCGICQNPLNNPIYTSCSRFTCATCLIRSIEVSQTTLPIM